MTKQQEQLFLAGEIVYFGEKNTQAIYIGEDTDIPKGFVRVVESVVNFEGKLINFIWILPKVQVRNRKKEKDSKNKCTEVACKK